MKITPPTPPGMTPAPDRGLFNPSERKRMRWLLFTFLLVVVSLGVVLAYVSLVRPATRRDAYGLLIDGCSVLPIVLAWVLHRVI